MSDLAARMLPYAAARMGLRPVDVHLVLTGPGGGTWDVAIGHGAGGQGDARPGGRRQGLAIVTDAVGFCRLAATGSPRPSSTRTSPATRAGPSAC